MQSLATERLIHSQMTKFHIMKKKIVEPSLFIVEEERGGLSKVFETDQGGGGRGGGGREGKLGGHIKTARDHRCWIIRKGALTNRPGHGLESSVSSSRPV